MADDIQINQGLSGPPSILLPKTNQKQEEKMAKNDNENAKILKQHSKEVFNQSVDLSVLKGIKQLPSIEEYRRAPLEMK